MTDPAISAAQKVLAAWSEDGEPEGAERYLAEAAAREALKPSSQGGRVFGTREDAAAHAKSLVAQLALE